MNLRLRFLVLLASVCLLTPLAATIPASADGELQVTVREVQVDRTALVQFLAKVTDQSGRPQRLNSSDFSVNVGAQAIPVVDVQTVTDAQVGISSLLFIDTSGSMVGTPLAAARAAASQYVQSLQRVDEVGVFSFAEGTNVIADFSNDFGAVDEQLSQLTAFGDTALYDAVADAAGRMAERPAARRVVIFLSDGEDWGISSVSRDQALASAVDSGVPFHVIGLSPSVDTEFLEQLAGGTGGAYYPAPSSDQLAAVFEEIALVLRSEYVVSVDFAGTGLGGDLTATVRAESSAGNGEIGIAVSLPAIPIEAQPRPTVETIIPQPVQIEAPPEQPEGGGDAGTIILAVFMLGIGALGGWLFWRRRQRRQQEEYVFGAPLYTPRDTGEPVQRTAPPAVLRLDTGEEFALDGLATLGVDEDCTYKLPLSRSEFGSADLRVWFANQRYVIRDSAPRTRIRVNGRPVAWSFLNDGDEIEVRGLKLQFATRAALTEV